MFDEKLKKIMEEREWTARQLCEQLNKHGVEVSLWTIRAWVQGSRQPKPYIQDSIIQLLKSLPTS